MRTGSCFSGRVGGKPRLRSTAATSPRGNAPLTADIRLTPGSYRVTAVAGGLAGSAQLEIGRDAASAVRIELR